PAEGPEGHRPGAGAPPDRAFRDQGRPPRNPGDDRQGPPSRGSGGGFDVKIHHLRPAPGSRRPRRRVGRGRAAGQGKTAGRGTKGWGARHQSKKGFEGGQMPLARRVPKLKGFTNPNREEYAAINVRRLSEVFEPKAQVGP